MTKISYLDIDLNELASKEIKKKIDSLEKENKQLYSRLAEENTIFENLKKQNLNNQSTLIIFDKLKKHFHEIKTGPEDSGGWYDSRQKLQYQYIEKILSNLFSVNSEFRGWLSNRSSGNLQTYLAVNFYHNREILIDLLRLLSVDNQAINFIKDFKMPYDYDKALVLKYVNSPQHNTNSCIFGPSPYWIEYGAKESNMPHDLIMANPHILEEDVFTSLLETIKKQKSNYHYLFALPKYNRNISDEQIQRMGEELVNMNSSHLGYSEPKEFILTNILKFSDITLDFLFNKCSAEEWSNSGINWEKFPVKYQMKFLNSKNIDDVLRILGNSKWSTEDKQIFLKQYLNK